MTRKRFVLHYGVLGFGGLSALLFSWQMSATSSMGFWPCLAINVPVWSLGGWFWGVWMWKWLCRQQQQSRRLAEVSVSHRESR